jgi:hypothetical protein
VLLQHTAVKKLGRHGISPAPKRKQSVACKNIRELVKTGSVNPLRLPARSPDLNSYAERWVRVDQRRVSVEADIVWRIVAAMSVAAIYRALPTVKAKTVGSCFLRRQRRKNMGAVRWHTKVLAVQIYGGVESARRQFAGACLSQ